MTVDKVQRFHDACRAVVLDCPDPYAKSYANAGLTMHDPEYIRAQCLYILNNMGAWRGQRAIEPRATFKNLSKEQSWK